MTEIITCITWLNTLYLTLKKNKGTYARPSVQNISGSKSGRLKGKVICMHPPPDFNRPKLSVCKEHLAPKWDESHFMLYVFPATHQKCNDHHKKSCTLLYLPEMRIIIIIIIIIISDSYASRDQDDPKTIHEDVSPQNLKKQTYAIANNREKRRSQPHRSASLNLAQHNSK
jgi:hypothetical protein